MVQLVDKHSWPEKQPACLSGETDWPRNFCWWRNVKILGACIHNICCWDNSWDDKEYLKETKAKQKQCTFVFQCRSSKGMQRGNCWCVDELGNSVPPRVGEDSILPCDGEWGQRRHYNSDPGGRGGVQEKGMTLVRCKTLPDQDTTGINHFTWKGPPLKSRPPHGRLTSLP